VKRAPIVLTRTEDYAAASPILRTVPPHRLRIVPNGVDPEQFPLCRSKDDYVLFVGRLVPYKGVDVLLRAMRIVQRRMHAPLRIVGDGPLRSVLEKSATNAALDCIFEGEIAEAALADRYGRARLTVLPSLNRQEAFGICLLESMSTGTPVVASALPGVRTVARMGGWTVPPGDPLALAATLEEILSDRVARPDPAALRAAVTYQYSWDVIVDKLRLAYGEAQGLHGTRHVDTTRRGGIGLSRGARKSAFS
jgi:glycosyltransferase involved in cell wall biosynthesis